MPFRRALHYAFRSRHHPAQPGHLRVALGCKIGRRPPTWIEHAYPAPIAVNGGAASSTGKQLNKRSCREPCRSTSRGGWVDGGVGRAFRHEDQRGVELRRVVQLFRRACPPHRLRLRRLPWCTDLSAGRQSSVRSPVPSAVCINYPGSLSSEGMAVPPPIVLTLRGRLSCRGTLVERLVVQQPQRVGNHEQGRPLMEDDRRTDVQP